MVEQLITEHLDLWTSAHTTRSTSGRGSSNKLELTGIKQLRELILELAVRGKLVPQDPEDEPSSDMLTRVAAERELLIEEKKIKKPANLKEIQAAEHPFKLPTGWQFAKLGLLMEMYNGRAFKSSEWGRSGLPIVRIQNLNDTTAPFNYYAGSVDEKNRIDTGTFLISWSGTPGTSFGAFIWDRGEAALNQHINKCVFFANELDPQYMQLAVNGQMNHFIANAQGGVGLKHVTKGTLNNAILGIPPKKEQARIVAKVDELMALCDQLEQQTKASISAHQTLVETLLATLTASADADELAQNWARLAEHFDTLFTTEHSIERLKQTILQLAVMGKLVPQSPSESSVSEVIDANPLRENAKTLLADQEAAAFDLPQGWEWYRLAEIMQKDRDISYGIIKLEKEPSSGGIPVLRCSDVKTGFIDLSGIRNVTAEIEEPYKRTRLQGGEVLVNIRGTLGGVALIPKELSGYNIGGCSKFCVSQIAS